MFFRLMDFLQKKQILQFEYVGINVILIIFQFKRDIRSMNTPSLSTCLKQLAELVHGGAENCPNQPQYQILLQQLFSLSHHSSLKIEQLQNQLKISKKASKNLKKENSSLKATVSNLKSDLEMMDIKNKKLHQDLAKFQQPQYKQERKENRKGQKQTKEIAIECNLLTPNFVDNIVQQYQQERKDNTHLLNKIGYLQNQLTHLQEQKDLYQNETSTLQDSDVQVQQISECNENPQEVVGEWQVQTASTSNFDAQPSNDIVSRFMHKFANLFHANQNQGL